MQGWTNYSQVERCQVLHFNLCRSMRSFQFDSGNYIEVEYMWELHRQVHLCERNLKTSQTLISTSGPQLRASVKRCIFHWFWRISTDTLIWALNPVLTSPAMILQLDLQVSSFCFEFYPLIYKKPKVQYHFWVVIKSGENYILIEVPRLPPPPFPSPRELSSLLSSFASVELKLYGWNTLK